MDYGIQCKSIKLLKINIRGGLLQYLGVEFLDFTAK